MDTCEQELLHALMRTLLRPQTFATEVEWRREAVELAVGLPGVRCAEFVVPGAPAVLRRADGGECRSDCPGRLAEATGPGRVVLTAEPGAGPARLVVSSEVDAAVEFEDHCRGRLELVQPAFEHGVRRALGARSMYERVEGILEVQPWPILLVDEDGTPVFRNRALRGLLEVEAEAERLMERLRAVAMELAEDGASRRRALSREDLEVTLPRCRVRLHPSRVEPGVLGDRRMILITVEAPELAYLDPTRLQREHGLSDREAEVAGHLIRGDSTKAIATALEISPKTAAHHVQAVLRKLGVSSRTAVAARLLGLRQAS